jgi:hypothetical protein
VSADEDLIRTFVERERRRIRRLSDRVGLVAVGLFVLGVILGMSVDARFALLAIAGGVLLVPALYLSRRAVQLAGPTSPLVGLVVEPSRIQKAELAIESVGTNRQVILRLAVAGGTTAYSVEHLAGEAPSPEANALLAAIHRRIATKPASR